MWVKQQNFEDIEKFEDRFDVLTVKKTFNAFPFIFQGHEKWEGFAVFLLMRMLWSPHAMFAYIKHLENVVERDREKHLLDLAVELLYQVNESHWLQHAIVKEERLEYCAARNLQGLNFFLQQDWGETKEAMKQSCTEIIADESFMTNRYKFDVSVCLLNRLPWHKHYNSNHALRAWLYVHDLPVPGDDFLNMGDGANTTDLPRGFKNMQQVNLALQKAGLPQMDAGRFAYYLCMRGRIPVPSEKKRLDSRVVDELIGQLGVLFDQGSGFGGGSS